MASNLARDHMSIRQPPWGAATNLYGTSMPKPGALACGLVLIFAAANALPSTHTHHDAVHDALLELEKDVSAMDSLPAQHGANFERRREACERRVSDDDDLLKACHKCLRWGWNRICSGTDAAFTQPRRGASRRVPRQPLSLPEASILLRVPMAG